MQHWTRDGGDHFGAPSASEDRHERRDELRALLDCLPCPVLVLDPPGTIVRANEAAALLVGHARTALVGQEVASVVPSIGLSTLSALLARARQLPQKLSELREVRVRGGLLVPMQISVSELPLRRKRYVMLTLLEAPAPRALVVPPDSALKMTLEAEADALRTRLRVEEERLANIVENSPGVVVCYERDAQGRTRFTYVSASAIELYGVRPEEIEEDELAVVSRVHPDDVGRLVGGLAQSARDGTHFYCDFRYDHPITGEKWLEASSKPRRAADGTVIWSGLVADITERKRVEGALVLARAQLESALEAAEMGAWVWDPKRALLWGNETQRRMWQLPDDAPTWVHPALAERTVHPDDRERVLSDIQKAMATGQRLETEYRMVLPGGAVRWLASRARVEPSRGEGNPGRLAGISLDVTQQRIASAAALRSHKLEALGTLAGGIAHDFNNVLFAIGGNAALALQALPSDSPIRGFLGEISSASARAAELVRQILAFSRPQDQKREVLSLAGPVEEALRLVRATLPAQVSIQLAIDPELPSVMGDAARIVQVVVNLCTNAAHAIGRRRAGTIDVRLALAEVGDEIALRVPHGRYALLTVSDDGCGMDDATQARILDPFFTTKPPGEGTGLGLSVVHGIVKALGGQLAFTSTPGGGTTFRIYLPASTEAPRPSRRTDSEPPRGRGKRILFVDDEAMIVTLGKSYLEVLGYRADAYENPHEALAAFRADPDGYAAVVTDLSMPAMSGFDLTRSLRSIRPTLPVLLMSGFIGPDERRHAARLGIHELALKPLTVDTLGELLGRVCSEADVGAS